MADQPPIMPPLDLAAFNPGQGELNPFTVIALALDRTLGDFTARLIFAASVKLLFKHARLFVYYRDDRPYKQALIRLVPQVERALRAAGDPSVTLDHFDIAGDRAIAGPPAWLQERLAWPHLLLTPSMMEPHRIPGFANRARLRVPDQNVPALSRALAGKGVDRERWFAVIHHREPTYEYRASRAMRDVDPADFLALRDFIIDGLGGQVVRLGHRGMTPFPERSGYVDLSGAEEGFPLQAFAASRARFAELTPSGPATLCSAFGTPVGQTNTVEWFALFNEHDLILPKHIITRDNHRLSLDTVRTHRLLSERVLARLIETRGCRVEPNTRDELFEVARRMHAATAGVEGWRGQPPVQDATDPPNAFQWPMPLVVRNRYIELPEFAPRYPVRDAPVP